MIEKSLAVFENYSIRRIYDEESEIWYFSVVDIIQALIQQPDYQAARNYWKVLKNRLNKEGSESVTKCNRLKMEAADGKKYLTDVADPETLLRLIQSVPSPKAEPIKLWLAKVGYEYLLMPEEAKLKGLDKYLRKTWLECCGHLSQFRIGRNITIAMGKKLGDILEPSMEFLYDYDFGSTTTLKVSVVGVGGGIMKK